MIDNDPTAFLSCIEVDCKGRYAITERIYTCRLCGGLLDVQYGFNLATTPTELRSIFRSRRASETELDCSGVWRFRELLPFVDEFSKVVTLAEGNTPIYQAPRSADYAGLDELRFKHQGMNPTGSFKDNGMTTGVTQAVALGAQAVACASTGNTSASMAAYAARAGLRSFVFIPADQISYGKLSQSLEYGAKVVEIEGNFDDAMRLVRELADETDIYLLNSINPFRLEGQKTIIIEMMEQCGWQAPDWIVLPGGNLGNTSAFGKALHEMHKLGFIDRMPRLAVIQAEGAAPFYDLWTSVQTLLEQTARPSTNAPSSSSSASSASFSASSASSAVDPLFRPVAHPSTLATAIKIGNPVSWKKALRSLRCTDGVVERVTEQEIADAKAIIGRDGIGCEPASAATLAGIKRLTASGVIKASDNVIAVLTGNLLKDPSYTIAYHSDTLAIDESGSRTELKAQFANRLIRTTLNKEAIKRALAL